MQTVNPPLKPIVFWVLWLAILAGLPVIYLVVGPRSSPASPPAAGLPLELIGLGPLLVSVVIRWVVLPRATSLAGALPLFVVGMAMAEGCGLIGLVLGKQFTWLLFGAAVAGVLQYAPVFAARLAESHRSPSGTRVIE